VEGGSHQDRIRSGFTKPVDVVPIADSAAGYQFHVWKLLSDCSHKPFRTTAAACTHSSQIEQNHTLHMATDHLSSDTKNITGVGQPPGGPIPQ
jgi:hypothetical protein